VRTTRPALDVLDRDQDRLLYDGDDDRNPPIQPLGDGFSTYWMALSWYQASTVRTLGHVEAVLEPSDIMPEAGAMEYLLRQHDADNAAYVRRRMVESLDDACDLAYRQFRDRAEEHGTTESDSKPSVNPENEANPLMRPAFKRLDASQSALLSDLWVGFESREELGRWVRSLTTASNGEKPEGLLDEIVRSGPLLSALLDTESNTATMTRYRFAVETLLPAFLAAARTLRGGERAESMSDVGGWTNA